MDTTPTRLAELKQMLLARRSVMQANLSERLRGGRADHGDDVGDIVDLCDTGVEEELSFALIQLNNETLSRIDAALERLEAGEYGRCFECGADLPSARLRAMPFAVRCIGCEERLEQGRSRDLHEVQLKSSMPLFPEFLRA